MKTQHSILNPWRPGQRIFALSDGELLGVVEYVEFNSEQQEYIAYLPDPTTPGFGTNIGDRELDTTVTIGQRWGEEAAVQQPLTALEEEQIESDYAEMIAREFHQRQ